MANLRIAELDFDQIKINLKNYLKAQSEFTDYDFEGSGLSVLIDILAYNTHYNAYLANMVVNEMFLDSAVKRSSAVSIAKHLGYTPRSARGSKAVINVTVNNPPGLPVTLTMPRNTPFTTTISDIGYTFYNTEEHTIVPSNGVYRFQNITVTEGTPLDFSFNVVAPGPEEKFVIPNSGIDTSTIRVTVQKSQSDLSSTTYNLTTDITNLDGTSKVYFLEQTPLGKFQIFFGDGVIGKKLEVGNIVRVNYLVASGPGADVSGAVAQSFLLGGAIGGTSSATIVTVSNSNGGAEEEDITSIKYNAPRVSSAKNRLVTAEDYSALIRANFTSIESVAVWGGEENVPTVYGKVFISLKPYEGNIVTQTVRDNIVNTLLKDRQILTVLPEFVEPDYLYVGMNVYINYEKNRTTRSAELIKSLAVTEIETFFDEELQKHDKDFYHSVLINRISDIDSGIVGVSLRPTLQKRLVPTLDAINSFVADNKIRFNHRLHPNEISSTAFYVVKDGETVTVKIRDVANENPPNYNGTGKLFLYDVETNTNILELGTVNYVTGDMEISNLLPVGYPVDAFDIRIKSELQSPIYDVFARRNQIVLLDDSTENTASSREAGLTILVTQV